MFTMWMFHMPTMKGSMATMALRESIPTVKTRQGNGWLRWCVLTARSFVSDDDVRNGLIEGLDST